MNQHTHTFIYVHTYIDSFQIYVHGFPRIWAIYVLFMWSIYLSFTLNQDSIRFVSCVPLDLMVFLIIYFLCLCDICVCVCVWWDKNGKDLEFQFSINLFFVSSFCFSVFFFIRLLDFYFLSLNLLTILFSIYFFIVSFFCTTRLLSVLLHVSKPPHKQAPRPQEIKALRRRHVGWHPRHHHHHRPISRDRKTERKIYINSLLRPKLAHERETDRECVCVCGLSPVFGSYIFPSPHSGFLLPRAWECCLVVLFVSYLYPCPHSRNFFGLA